MNLKTVIVLAISLFGVLNYQAQESTDKVLFTLDGKPYFSEEFLRVYNKNLNLVEDEAQRDIKSYLDLYILYKLKVARAYELNLDDDETYKAELKTNRDQLAERYLTDEKITEELVKEAYDRSLKDVNADHILFLVKPFADSSDTLRIYNRAIEVRNMIVEGADFNETAKKYSEDPSANKTGGELGTFSAFTMVYPFETGAYNTKVGEVSMPIRTQFGYHLIKVNSIDDNLGELTVAHILLRKPKLEDKENKKVFEKELIEVENKIYQISDELKDGANFEDLVSVYSQDEGTIKNGGVLPPLSRSTVIVGATEFKKVIFDLKEIGDISNPIETPYGWHIVKLIEKHPLKPFEEVKASFVNKVKRDSRSRVIKDRLMHTIKERYTIKENKVLKQRLNKIITEDFYEKPFETPANINKYKDALVVIDGSLVLSTADFIEYLQKNQQKYLTVDNLSKVINLAYDNFLDDNLRTYYINNLEKEYPEFDNTVNEYREGLLLFDLMKIEIWDKVKIDTLGYTAYYEENKDKYVQEPRLGLSLYSFDKENKANKALKNFKKDLEYKLNLKKYKATEIKGIYDLDNPLITKNHLPMEVGVYGVFNNQGYSEVIVVDQVYPKRLKSFDEVKQQVIYDYQEKFEELWIEKLKSSKQIKVNVDVFEEIKQNIKNE